jgi:ABC-type multidrug transport system ATPase subunit
LEEVDLLSDRVAILTKGKIVTTGTTLFLKHHFGVGYSLRFEASENLCASVYVAGATSVPSDKPGAYHWNLKHDSEAHFPELLTELDENQAEMCHLN